MYLSDDRIKSSLIYLFSVVLILFPAFYNGYPLVTSDSGAYINNGFEIMVPIDRPLTYSIFIRIASLGISLWGVLLVQAALLLFFMQLLVRNFFKERYSPFLFLAIVLFTVIGTSAGWFCSQIMPDIFTPILLLAVCTMFFVPMDKKWQHALLYVFIWGAIIMHNAHLIATLLTAVAAGVYYWSRNNKVFLRKSITLFALSISGFLTLSTLNAISGKGFRTSAASHVFIMCRMVESGIMDQFLSDQCATNQYKLCEYRDQLPLRQWGFQWDENSPLYKTGGWQANEKEYNAIIWKTLTTPKYLGLHILKSTEATLRQIPQIYVGDGLMPMTENTNPYWKVQSHYGHELKEYLSSLQNINELKFGFFNSIIVLVAFLSCMVALFVRSQVSGNRTSSHVNWTGIFGIVMLFIFFNAFATATFSTIIGRLHARVFWVLPFFCFVYILDNVMTLNRKVVKKSEVMLAD